MNHYIGYAESVSRVGVFVEARASSAYEFERQIDNLALGYRVYAVWQRRFLQKPELIWTKSEAKARELEFSLKKSRPLNLKQVRAEKAEEFSRATSTSSLLAMAGANLAAVQAGSIVFDAARIPDENYVEKVFDAEVLNFYRELSPFRTAIDCLDPIDREVKIALAGSSSESHTVILAGIFIALSKAGDPAFANSRTTYLKFSKLLQLVTKGNGDLYSACCISVASALRY